MAEPPPPASPMSERMNATHIHSFTEENGESVAASLQSLARHRVLQHDDLLSLIFHKLSAPVLRKIAPTCKSWDQVSVQVCLRCAERWIYRPKAAYLPVESHSETQGKRPLFDPANYGACGRTLYRPTSMGKGQLPMDTMAGKEVPYLPVVPIRPAVIPRPAVASMPLSPNSERRATRLARLISALKLSSDSLIRTRMMRLSSSPCTPRRSYARNRCSRAVER